MGALFEHALSLCCRCSGATRSSLWFFAYLYTVLDASIPVFWASVGDFFGRKSFGAIRGNMNLFAGKIPG